MISRAKSKSFACLLYSDSDIRTGHTLAEKFGRLVRERHAAALDGWLARAQASGLVEFRDVAIVMRRDYAAVKAALTYEWISGQTEGEITRLKLVKLQMFDRASLPLLKTRVLRAAGDQHRN